MPEICQSGRSIERVVSSLPIIIEGAKQGGVARTRDVFKNEHETALHVGRYDHCLRDGERFERVGGGRRQQPAAHRCPLLRCLRCRQFGCIFPHRHTGFNQLMQRPLRTFGISPSRSRQYKRLLFGNNTLDAFTVTNLNTVLDDGRPTTVDPSAGFTVPNPPPFNSVLQTADDLRKPGPQATTSSWSFPASCRTPHQKKAVSTSSRGKISERPAAGGNLAAAVGRPGLCVRVPAPPHAGGYLTASTQEGPRRLEQAKAIWINCDVVHDRSGKQGRAAIT